MAFPQSLLGIKVELFYDGIWNPLPPGTVRGVGAEDGEISIGPRGQADESSGIATTQAQLSINNRNGRYSPRNLVSDLYGKIGANTPLRITADVGPVTTLTDTFDVNGTNGWPTAPTGQVYTSSGGATSNYLVETSSAVHRHTTLNVERTSTMAGVTSTDHEILISSLLLANTPTGDNAEVIIRSRETANSFVQTRLVMKADNSVDCIMDYMSNGVLTSNVFVATVPSLFANDVMNVRIQMLEGGRYRARAWWVSFPEPLAWNTEVVGLKFVGAGVISIRSRLGAAVSNVLPFDIRYGALSITYGIPLYTGEVTEWPQNWDSTGSDVWVSLQISGITRRLQQNAKPLRSALFRHFQRRDLLGYWSFERLSGDQGAYINGLASDLNGAPPFATQTYPDPVISGIYGGAPSINWAGDDTLLGSEDLPVATKGTEVITSMTFNNGQLLSTDITDDAFSVGFWMNGSITEASSVSGLIIALTMGNGDCGEWIIQANHISSAVPVFTTQLYFASTLVNGTAGPGIGTTTISYSPGWHYYMFIGVKSGANITMRICVDNVQVVTGSAAITLVGQPVAIRGAALQLSGASSSKASWGHLAVSSGQGGDDLVNNQGTTLSIGREAYAGENAAGRIGRLFNEEGYTIDLDYDATFATPLGPQGTKTFLDSVEEAAIADDGVLFEQKGKLGYYYVARGRLYNRDSQITLDYTNTDLSDVPEVTDDDQRTVNKFTAKREQSGAVVTVERITGPLSTNDPTNSTPGAGVYDDSKTVNLYEDAQLLDYANWRVHLGTWDESRWPQIKIALHRTPFANNLAQLTRAIFLEVAEVMTVINTPEWLPPGSTLLQMRAVKLFLSNFNFGIEWTALPAGPWNVAEAGGAYETGAARADTAKSTLVTTVTDSSTELVLLTNETNLPWSDPMWTEDDSQLDYPHETGFDLRLNPQTRRGGGGGERVRVLPVYSVLDTFTRAAQLSGSNADTGQTWAASTMTAAQPLTNGTDAVFVHAAANTEAFVVLPAGFVDGVVTAYITPSVNQATVNTLQAHIVARYVDANNYYAARLTLQVAAPLCTLDIIKVVAGVATIVSAGTDSPVSVLTGSGIWLKLGIYGRNLSAKTWRSIDLEPEWQQEVIGAASENMTGTGIGIRTLRNVGNTNANSGFSFARINMNTGAIRPYAYDYFNRTTVNGLGSAVVGGSAVAWTIYAVTAPISAADHQVTPNQATVTIPAVNAIRGGFLQAQVLADCQVSALISMPLATGGSLSSVLFARGSAVLFRLVASTTNTITITAFDTGGSIGSMLIPFITHAALNKYRFKIYVAGNKGGAKVWLDGQNEPDNWMMTVTTVALTPSFSGWFGQRDGGNTNVNPQFTFADFKINNPQRITVQRGMDGVARAWDAGIDARLWTPTRLAR